MAGLKFYESGGKIYVDNRLLAECTKITVKDAGNLSKVYTTILGLAGFAAGPIEAEMTIEQAMPKAGAEFAWASALTTRKILTVRIESEGVRESYQMVNGDLERTFSPSDSATKMLQLLGKKIGTST